MARSRASSIGTYARFAPMQMAVRPKPVAAMLAAVRESLAARTLKRSRTSPVAGSVCSQKKSKVARWISSSSRSPAAADADPAFDACWAGAAPKPAAAAISPPPRPASTWRRGMDGVRKGISAAVDLLPRRH